MWGADKVFSFVIMFLLFSCREKARNSYELIVMPKTTRFGASRLSIESYSGLRFQTNGHEIHKQSNYVAYGSRTFECLTKKDELCEYYFENSNGIKITDSLLNSLILYKKDTSETYSSVIYFKSFNSKDTGVELKVTSDSIIFIEGNAYYPNQELFKKLFEKVPIEIFENWKYNLGARYFHNKGVKISKLLTKYPNLLNDTTVILHNKKSHKEIRLIDIDSINGNAP